MDWRTVLERQRGLIILQNRLWNSHPACYQLLVSSQLWFSKNLIVMLSTFSELTLDNCLNNQPPCCSRGKDRIWHNSQHNLNWQVQYRGNLYNKIDFLFSSLGMFTLIIFIKHGYFRCIYIAVRERKIVQIVLLLKQLCVHLENVFAKRHIYYWMCFITVSI